MKTIKTKAMMTKVANRIEKDVKEALSIYTYSTFNVMQHPVGDKFKEIRISREDDYFKQFTSAIIKDCVEIEERYNKQYNGLVLTFEAKKEYHYDYEGGKMIETTIPCIIFTVGIYEQ